MKKEIESEETELANSAAKEMYLGFFNLNSGKTLSGSELQTYDQLEEHRKELWRVAAHAALKAAVSCMCGGSDKEPV